MQPRLTPRTNANIRESFRFRCTLRDDSLDIGNNRRVQVEWLAPSGRTIDLGYSAISRRFCDDLFHDSSSAVVDHEHYLLSVFLGLLGDKTYEAGLKGTHAWLGRLIYGEPLRPHFPAPRRRHAMSREQCRELGELVRQNIAGETPCCDIVDWLNDCGANSSILDSIRDLIDDTIVYGVCDHFMLADGASGYRDGGYVCDDCAENGEYEYAADAYGLWLREDLYYHESDGEYYTYPEDDEDDEDDEDEPDGRSDSDNRGLRNYCCEVTHELGGAPFVSTADGPFTIGVELEVHAALGKRSALIDTVMAQQGERIICKNDASLGSQRGVELVTKPLTCQQAVELFSKLEFPQGTTAWDARCCGMHVHIDSQAFTKLSIAKFLAFWNDPLNAEFIRQVAGRHPDFDKQARHYAARADVPDEGSVLARAKHPSHGEGRYRIVNLCNLSQRARGHLGIAEEGVCSNRPFSTVELRIFRASLRKERLLAQIELAAASVYFARDTSFNATGADEFEDWLRGNTALYSHLAAFLKLIRPHKPAPGAVAVVDETVSVD